MLKPDTIFFSPFFSLCFGGRGEIREWMVEIWKHACAWRLQLVDIVVDLNI